MGKTLARTSPRSATTALQAGDGSAIRPPAPRLQAGKPPGDTTPKPRIVWVGGSLLFVVLAYWLYALLVVPWIEPPADSLRIERLTAAEQASAQRALSERVAELKPLFRPGDWELNAPKILEMDNSLIKLLWQNYTTTEDGCSYKIEPCTLVYTPAEPADNPAERIRRSIVLQAPQGAVLQFDKGFDLLRGKPEGLLRGDLLGSVTIRSAGKDPGPGDDLLVVTKNVHLSNDRVGTTSPVDFRWGKSYGRGTNLQIGLLQDVPSGSTNRAPKILGIDWVEIRHIDRLHLEFDQDQTMGPPPAGAAALRTGKAPAAEPAVVEVTARGPMRFSVTERRVRLQDQVNVLQLHPNGPSDQLNCEVLSIDFARRRLLSSETSQTDEAATAESSALTDLQPRRIEADGNPVIVHAPSRQFEARGNRLEYDLWSGRIFLRGTPEAMLQQGPNEIHAPSFQYQPAEQQWQSLASAPGPGWMRARTGDRPDQQFEAHWTGRLSVGPHEQQQVISLTGGTRVVLPAFGSLSAGEIHLRLLQSPVAPGQPSRPRPDRMNALRQVRLDSRQLSGNVEVLEVWFQEPDPAQEAAEQQMAAQGGFAARVQSQLEQAQLAAQLAKTFSPPGAPNPLAPAASPTTDSGAPKNHFEVAANRLQALVTIRGTEMKPSELTVEGNVRLAETITEQPNQRPVVITGDQIHVVHAAQPYAAATIIGRPARFEGQGLVMRGANINVNRGQNRLWIDGAGDMERLIDRDLEGRPLANANPLNIRWQQGMNFDGKTASFNGSVLASLQQRQLKTDVLKATFQRAIRFADTGPQSPPVLEQVACEGSVVMDDRGVEAGNQTSQTHVETNALRIQLITGEITANGSGFITDMRRGSAGLGSLGSLPAAAPEAPSPTNTAAKDKQLHYLNVRFQDGITGNVRNRTVTFHQGVQAIYGPVASWKDRLDSADPNGPKPGCTLLTSDSLRVADVPLPTDAKRSAAELAAQGNAVVQGTTLTGATFTARAHQILYAEAKDQLILDWNGTTPVELFYQKTIGGQPLHDVAQKIIFYPSTMNLDVYGQRQAELQQPPSSR